MGYAVQLYSIQTMHNFDHTDDTFFEHIENFVPFSSEQFSALKQRLINYGYVIEHIDNDTIYFNKQAEESTLQCCLTQYAVYFSSGFNQNAIFEICMTGSEFTDTGEFAKYDPQLGEWET